MTQLQMVYTLRTGTQERWRRLSQEVAGSRRAQFEASCRQAGITQVQVWLVQLPRSELLVVTMDTQEPQQVLSVTSQKPERRKLMSRNKTRDTSTASQVHASEPASGQGGRVRRTKQADYQPHCLTKNLARGFA